jgi:pectate lyase
MSDNYFNAIDAGLASDNNANVNAAALQRLTDSVQAAGGGTITIPPGIYAINGTISLDPPVGSSIDIRGCATLVKTAGAEVPLFGIGAEDDECGHVVIANLQIQGDPFKTDPEQITAIKISETWVGGEKKFG